jgi:cell division protease FtsH
VWLIAAAIFAGLWIVMLSGGASRSNPVRSLPFSGFESAVSQGQIKTAAIAPDGAVHGLLTGGQSYTSRIPTALADPGVAPLLAAHHVLVSGTASSGGVSAFTVVADLLPLLLFGLFIVIARRAAKKLGASGVGGLMGFTGSRAKVYDEDRPITRFADVAGYDGPKQEISEVVDFLKDPERFRRAGANGPRGVLMVGPPGTGKTLMARAVAGEAGVPFLALTGSSFVELFVGVGASRVRDLFADARKRSPSIIFIDEIDAIGGRRGSGLGRAATTSANKH